MLSPVLRAAQPKADKPSKDSPAKPTPQQLAWQELELGALFHVDVSVFRKGGWNYVLKDSPYDPNIFQPERLDTDQWVRAAKAAGARYAIFTATHFEGFMNWQSDIYPYGLKQTSWRDGKGDIVGDFVKSCRKFGLKPGLYYSTARNSYHKVAGHRVNWGKGGDAQKAYNTVCERMCEELCSRYGDLLELWMDAGVLTPEEGGPDLQPIVRKHQPKIIFYHSNERRDRRWCGRSDAGVVDYPCWSTSVGPDYRGVRGLSRYLKSGDPDGPLWSPAHSGLPLRTGKGWCWTADNGRRLKPVGRLVNSYYNTVGRNANLVLGVCVDQHGLVPEKDLRVLEQFGKKISDLFGDPIAQTRGTGDLYEVDLKASRTIDHVVMMEDLREGHRVREYAVEGLISDKGWQPLASGTAIGHKRIERFKPVDVTKVRVRIARSVGTPTLRNVSVFGPGE